MALFKTNDAIALSASVAYEVGMDYNKVIKNPMILAEKASYQVGGKLLQPMINDFMPKFLKDKEDFLYLKSNQEHLTTGLLCFAHNYWGKNNNWKQSAKQGAIEGVSSLVGEQIRKSLSTNPNINLKDEIII
tara:strand:- start:3548 stop:3943 length:396 start_codon:yes stop_codon:yes gene_type:complete